MEKFILRDESGYYLRHDFKGFTAKPADAWWGIEAAVKHLKKSCPQYSSLEMVKQKDALPPEKKTRHQKTSQ